MPTTNSRDDEDDESGGTTRTNQGGLLQTAQMMLVIVWAVKYVFFLFNLISFTNDCFLSFLSFANEPPRNAPGPSHPCPMSPLRASAHRVATGTATSRQQQQQQPGTMADTMSEHHQPAYEPLLVGGNGGANDKQQHIQGGADRRQGAENG